MPEITSRSSLSSQPSFWLALFCLILGVIDAGSSDAEAAEAKSAATPAASVELSEAERAWLAARHVVRARVADTPPYTFLRPAPSGMSVDYLSAVARRFGFKVEFVADTGSLPHALRDVAGPRARFDLLLTVSRSPERARQFAMTKDYVTAPWVVFARRDSPYVVGLPSLNGKTVAGERGFVVTDRIRAEYPAIHLLEVDSSEDALLAVATGRADAYVGNLATGSYLVKANRLDNLVVTGPSGYGLNAQAMAVRSDWPELASLIDKGIDAISAEERIAIGQKWGNLEFRAAPDYALIRQIVGVALLILLAFFYWNRRLAREVALRKKVEEGLRLAKDLAESANRAKTTFLATMSHELRTPMNAIIGMTEVVKRKLTDPQQIDQLQTALDASRQLLSLINDILEYSRLEANTLRVERATFSLDKLLEELTQCFEESARRKGLNFTLEVDPQLAARRFSGDPALLGQVLFKLADNAVKFTESGGVHVRVTHNGNSDDGTLLRFEVADTGIGIAVEDQRRLFSAFEQLDGSSTRKFGGAGIGLAICKQLVKAMDGDIGLDSRPGAGSTFWFTVPLGPAPESLPAPPAAH